MLMRNDTTPFLPARPHGLTPEKPLGLTVPELNDVLVAIGDREAIASSTQERARLRRSRARFERVLSDLLAE
jgi:hypothetical protein